MNYAIYGAGKTWMAPRLQWVRDELKYNINSRWIDIQDTLATFDSVFPDEIHNDEDYKRRIWDEGCLQDCTTCDYMVLLAHPRDGEKHSGSLVELGIVTGQGKPVYIIGTAASFEPQGHSDRAWRSQSLVTWLPHLDPMSDYDLAYGFAAAKQHYAEHYDTQLVTA